MRHLLVIVLGLCIMAPGIGTWGWLHLQKAQVRKAVKRQIIAGMDRQDLTLLTFHVDDAEKLLKWHHAGEFEFRDEMYDIVERKVRGDSISYWCFWDQQESLIYNQLTELASQQSGTDDGQAQQRLLDFFKTLYFDQSPASVPLSSIATKPHMWTSQLSDQYRYSPPAPPPDRV